MLVAADKHIISLSEACLVEVAGSADCIYKSLNNAARLTTNSHVGSSVPCFPDHLSPRSFLQLRRLLVVYST